MPDCQRRTTSAISTLDTSLYAIAAPYIQPAAMVANPAPRVVKPPGEVVYRSWRSPLLLVHTSWRLTSSDPIRRLLVSCRELGPGTAGGGQGGMAPGRAVPSGGLHRHEHDGWPRRSGAILQWSRDSRAVDQGGEVRPELDSAVVPSVRGQPGASVSVRPSVQPWELPSQAVSAQGGQALVAAERAGEADQDGRPSGAALPAIDLSAG